MLAVVVTHLVCDRFTAPLPAPDGVHLSRETGISGATYRDLFRLIGRDWLWASRLMLDDDDLMAVIRDPDVALYTVHDDTGRLGMVELDYRQADAPQIAFFGLTSAAQGRGIGNWLMAHVQHMMARRGARRIYLNTCTLDAPRAIPFYLRHGFRAERREVQVFPDPRMRGLLDTGAAPSVPML